MQCSKASSRGVRKTSGSWNPASRQARSSAVAVGAAAPATTLRYAKALESRLHDAVRGLETLDLAGKSHKPNSQTAPATAPDDTSY